MRNPQLWQRVRYTGGFKEFEGQDYEVVYLYPNGQDIDVYGLVDGTIRKKSRVDFEPVAPRGVQQLAPHKCPTCDRPFGPSQQATTKATYTSLEDDRLRVTFESKQGKFKIEGPRPAVRRFLVARGL